MSENPAGGWPPQEPAVSSLARSWGVVLALGVLGIVLGIVVMLNTNATLKAIAFLVGLQFLVLGVVSLIKTFATHGIDAGQRVLLAILGLLGVIVGVVTMKNPGLTIGVLVILIGALWLVQGIVEFFGALGDPGMPARGWRIFGGLITAIAGVVVLFWPAPTAYVLAWIIGLWLLFYGIFGVLAALRLRKLEEELVPGPGGPSMQL